jgi:hypothetical protein
MDKQPIIDAHMHAVPARLSPDGKPLQHPVTGETSAITSDEELIQSTLAAMDEHNIIRGFLSETLDMVYRWVEAAPKRFIPSPSIYRVAPGEWNPAIDLLRAEFRAGRISAVGEIASQYFGVPAHDPQLEPYFALAEELDVPVLVHSCGGGAFIPSFRCSLGNPLLLEEVIVKHPKLRLWVENAGYPFLSEITALMLQYPQIYADVSTITWDIPREAFHDYLQSLMRLAYPRSNNPVGKRLMFGTDFMGWPSVIGAAVESIESADFLTEGQKRDLFYNNAAQFFRLD